MGGIGPSSLRSPPRLRTGWVSTWQRCELSTFPVFRGIILPTSTRHVPLHHCSPVDRALKSTFRIGNCDKTSLAEVDILIGRGRDYHVIISNQLDLQVVQGYITELEQIRTESAGLMDDLELLTKQGNSLFGKLRLEAPSS